MGIARGPKIVTSGLVLALDAADKLSYKGSGTSWRDLSSNNNTGTLTNGPTFNATNMGSIVFDGVDDYVDAGNSSTLQITQGSIATWIKTSDSSAGFHGILVKQSNYGLFANAGVLVAYDWGNAATRSTGVTISDGRWKYIAMTFTTSTGTPSNNAIFYINGVAVLTSTIKWSTDVSILTLGLGGLASAQWFNGNISNVQIYNRVLSSSEILFNYNATKNRFGL